MEIYPHYWSTTEGPPEQSGTLMKASKLPQFQKELHLSNLHSLQNTGTNPNTRVSRNKITNNFRCMSNGTHFHFQQFHTHWSDLLDFPVSQRNNYVLSVKETIMLTKSNQNSRNSILWVGCKTDFTEWIVKPKESKTWQVTIIALWLSRNIRAIDMHDFRMDVHNLLGSATQSDSTDPLGVYNTCLRQLLDRHAPLVTRTVTDRTSAPWMTLEIKQAKVQWRLAERKWRESGLAVHREIYVKQRNLVSNMISKVKKDYLCDKIVNCGSSRELFRLSSQMMGKSGDTMLPSNISPESLPDKFNEFFVHKIDEIRRSFDPDRPIPTNPVEFSGTTFAEFQLVTEDFVKTVVQEMP